MSTDKNFPATAMPDDDWWNELWPDPSAVLENLGFTKGMSAVDLCCGNGHFTLPMTVLLEGKVTAVDLHADLLEQAKQRLFDADAPECNWVLGDAMEMADLIGHHVNAVLIANTFHGVPEQTKLAAAVGEILKSGGKFIVINWHVIPRENTPVLGQPRGPKTELRMAANDVKAVVEPSGLTFASIVELPPYHYGIIFEKP